jgi:rod shape-determining protein MreC
MALRPVGRRRVIIALLLTAVLLLTLDLRGNAVFDTARSGFSLVLSPVRTAIDVATRPVSNAWRGITEFDDLVAENRRLQEQIDAQRGAEIAARKALVENQQLLALNDLEALANIPTVTAQIIGASPTNLDQVIEIDRGSLDGIDVGMAVVNEAGLVGKITRVFPRTSLVMLITDTRYAVPVRILSDETTGPTTTPPSTVPSGETVEDLSTTTTSTTVPFRDPLAPISPTTSAPPVDPSATGDPAGTGGSVPGEATGSSVPALDPLAAEDGSTTTSTSTTTTTVPVLVVERETGVLQGQGAERLPRVTFVADTPTFGRPKVGDSVFTTGGRTSLAPAGIPVGVIANVIMRPGAEGTILEIETSADLSSLQFVRVVRYKPPAEAGG